MMRQSIEATTLAHDNPIPCASRIGPLIESSIIPPFNPDTRELPDSLEAQIDNLFTHMGSMLSEAGAGWDDVVKVMFFCGDRAVRTAINGPWVERFPDPDSRPARHTQVVDASGAMRISCVFTAYVAALSG